MTAAVILSETHRPDRHELGAVHMFQSPWSAFGGLSDPILQVDHFFMSYPHFPPHPHAGFSAVTYMLENSPGGFVNRDSRGDRSYINPGDLHWTWAGSGILHEEVPQKPGTTCHGLQIFVNMAALNRKRPPQVFHLGCTEQPSKHLESVRLKVVVGAAGGLISPVQVPDPFSLLDLRFSKGARYLHDVEAGWGGLLMAIDGEFTIKTDGGSVELMANDSVAFVGNTSGNLEIAARTYGTLIVLTGKQLREPFVSGGPFVMGSESELTSAVERYRSGAMGNLKKSF